MSTIHDGFSATDYQPVAETFFGFRAFKVTVTGKDPAGPARPVLYGTRTGFRGIQTPVSGDDDVRGGLRGLFKQQFQWGDGTNRAACLRYWSSNGPQPVHMVDGKPHSLLLPECDCGFWAYTNGTHTLSCNGPAVLGIIEGWGRMVLGPDGFRAEKARIVALAFPTRGEVTPVDEVSARLTDTVGRFSHAMRALGRSIGEAVEALTLAALGQAPPPTPLPPPVIDPPPMRALRPWENIDPALRRAIERAYPSARIFETVAAMQAEFPLSDLRALLPPPQADEADDADEAAS